MEFNIKSLLISLCAFLVISTSSYGDSEELKDAIANGKQEFQDSCFLCHGDDGKGKGPFASMLVIKTADLTKLSKNNNGAFPFKEVYLSIDGRDQIKQHGPRQMPIWGDRFQATTWASVSTDHASTLVRGKIFELMLYIESIQE